MQYFLVVGLIVGYPLSEKLDDAKLAFWGLAIATLLAGFGSLFCLNTQCFIRGEVDTSFKMSLATVIFKRVDAQ